MALPVIPVLLSGGRGTRLWPLSRTSRPKQLQPLLGATTMLQATATRLDGVSGLGAPYLICGASHVTEAIDQLRAVGREPAVTVAEPVGRNTAAAIAAAALIAPREAVLVVLPADHIVIDLAAFRTSMQVAIGAASDGNVVTFGVVPTHAETGYGYIEAGDDTEVRQITEFVEKPDADTAAHYLAGGRHFWNSGMFVVRPDVALDELRRHAPGVVDVVGRSMAGQSGPVIQPGPEFGHVVSVPFDVAVMEKTDRAVMVSLDAGWSDVGTWRSLWEVSDRDGDGNVLAGDVVAHGVRDSYVRSSGRPIVVLGLDGAIVVDAGDVVFVAGMDRHQEVRELVERLDRDRPELG